MGRYGPAAADPAVVTAADMVAGHVTLDISCPDRLYLNGYVAKLQTPGGVVYFFHDHRGKPIASPALFEPIGEKSEGPPRGRGLVAEDGPLHSHDHSRRARPGREGRAATAQPGRRGDAAHGA